MTKTKKVKSQASMIREKVSELVDNFVFKKGDHLEFRPKGHEFEHWLSGVFYDFLKQQREEILTDLYGIRANIPLTTGMASRKQMKELIKKLEKIK